MARRSLKIKTHTTAPGCGVVPSPQLGAVQRVSAAHIRQDPLFCWRHTLKDGTLTSSIKKSGILIPLVVQKHKKKYRIIAGHRRFEAARALKLKRIPVFEIAENMNAKDAFILALVSNWRQEVSDMDRARAIAKAVCEFRFKPDEVRNTVMPLLGLPSDQRTFELYLKADTMQASLKDLFEERKVPLRSCGTLLKFSAADQALFASKAGVKMKLTVSQFLQVMEWLADIVKRDGRTLKEIFALPDLRKILGHKTMDPRTRADRFFSAVKRIRFPGYSERLEQFEKASAAILHEAGRLRIEPAAGFEEKGIELRARVKTPKDLDLVLQKLSESRSALISLFDFML